MFGVKVINYPRVTITEKYASMGARAQASMYVDDDGHEVTAFTLQLVSR